MTYEIYSPNALDRSEFAGTRSGTWAPLRDGYGYCDTLEEARALVAVLHAEDDEPTTYAIFEDGGRYPLEIIEADQP